MDPATASFAQLANKISEIIIPIVIVVGVVSSTLNIMVLTRPALYQHACSHYFLANAASNLFYSGVLLVYRLLADQYQIDAGRLSNGLCKFIMYVNHAGISLPSTFLLLASIDRWCASSSNAQIRKFSNVKTARRLICLTIVLILLFYVNSAIAVDLRTMDPFGCNIRADTPYKQVYAVVQACMISVIPPCLMGLFGFMTIYNINQTRMLPAVISRNRRTATQLAWMLLLQVATHILLNLPSTVTYLIFVLPNALKLAPGFFFASMLSLLPFHISYVTAFFLYILSAKIYRTELIRLTSRIFRLNRIMPFHSSSVTNNAIPMTV